MASGLWATLGHVSAAASGTTGAFLDGEPGSGVAGGESLAFSGVTLASTSTASSVQVNLASPGHSFQVVLSAPTGQLLTTGTYDGAEQSATQSNPGLAVMGDSQSCSSVAGRFIVDEITVTAAVVQTLSARFEAHCNGSDAALFGAVSVAASAPYRSRTVSTNEIDYGSVVDNQSSSQAVTITNDGPSSLRMQSASITGNTTATPYFQLTGGSCINATVSAGHSCTYMVQFAPTGVISGAYTADLTFFDDLAPTGGSGRDIVLSGTATRPPDIGAAVIDGEAGSLQALTIVHTVVSAYADAGGNVVDVIARVSPSNNNLMRVLFEAPNGQVLAPGTYENALPLYNGANPGLNVFPDDGAGCNPTTGRFIVDELTFDNAGNVWRLAARFELHCVNAGSVEDPAIFGAVSFNAAVTPFRSRTVSTNSLDFGSTPFDQVPPDQEVTVTNNGTASLALARASITGADASNFQLRADTCSQTTLAAGQSCSYLVRFTPSGMAGTRQALLTFYDDLAPSGGGGTGRDIVLTGTILPNTTCRLGIPWVCLILWSWRNGVAAPWPFQFSAVRSGTASASSAGAKTRRHSTRDAMRNVHGSTDAAAPSEPLVSDPKFTG